MANTITQTEVLTSLHNLMGHRVAPGGTDDDLKRYCQSAFDYAWRYFKWGFSLGSGSISAVDGLLPTDFDIEGWRQFNGITEVGLEDTIGTGNTGSAITWDSTSGRFKMSPLVGGNIVYQKTPPTLSETPVPFPSAQVIAIGALIYAKIGENPSRADVKQEWDMFHSELDRLAGRSYSNRTHTPRSRHDVTGTFTGAV